ncbi:MAG: TIGR02452 family protein [Cyanobacteriota bacterium]|nr:TIGR02452 family protein [Cyanobacteriota bacterium]
MGAEGRLVRLVTLLYLSLTQDMTYYDRNRSHSSPLYTNHIVYSPSVPVFRDDRDRLIAPPYQISIVTSAAVNAGAVRQNKPAYIPQIQPTMEARICSVLAVALQHQHQSLVLGAYGCGECSAVFVLSDASSLGCEDFVLDWAFKHLK